MIWYEDRELVIRSMEETDAQVFYDEYSAQGWHPDISVYQRRLKDQAEGKCMAFIAVYRGQPAGSVYLYLTVKEGPFKGKGWPMIVDFSVLQKYQRKGIGSRLMDAAERIAGQYADTVCLGVGLHDGYGSAQRMYVKRGYIPDGSGVWYQNKPCIQYETVCTVDDDLVLYLSKKLTGFRSKPGENRTPDGLVRAEASEAGIVAALACELWPGHTPEEMTMEFESVFSGAETAVFLYRRSGQPVGFAQCQLRHDYVEGTETSPVGYLEGVYVQESCRQQGIACLLLKACEQWAKEQGCSEFASDCELTNLESQAFHQAVGFEETNRIVTYVRHI